MDILLISLAPVAIIAGYIWFRDKYEREPFRMLFFSLLAGALIVVPVIFAENLISIPGEGLEGIPAAAWKAFAVAGFTEEVFKYLALFLLIWKSREFNDKYDGIVYGTFLSLGFAGVENILYVFSEGYSTGLVRAFTAVPAHAIFGITMGFYLGLAKFYPRKRRALQWRALLIPILLHGIYDFILMTGIEWLWIVFFAFLVFLYISAFRRLKRLSDASYFNTDYDLLNSKLSNNDQNT
ncbi:MAG TPA: PrsW family glutamic-type intramembrane protease [Prolixibacteraceae bacterium]|nr:PrsW family glutamic-type intramembrane protease [Prolixibacteraceae bacterium]